MSVYAGLQIGKNKIEAAALREGTKTTEALENISARYGDDRSMLNALTECAEKFKEYSAVWTVGLPADEFSFRYLTFPFKNMRTIKSLLKFELESLLPYGAEELEASALLLSSTDKETKVLACAIRKERLKYYTDALDEAGIEPSVITPDVTALLPFYKKIIVPALTESGSANALIVNADSETMWLCFSGSGGYVDFHAALPDSGELKRFLAAREEQPEKIYMAGSNTESLKPAISRSDGIFSLHENGDLWKEEISDYVGGGEKPDRVMIPLGLAVRGSEGLEEGFNLSPRSDIAGRLAATYRYAAIGIALCLLLWIGFLGYRNHVKEGIYGKTKAEIRHVFETALPGVRMVKPTFQMKQYLKNINVKLRRAGIVENRRVDLLWIIRQVSEKLHAGMAVEIDEISYDESGVTIQGKTDGFEAVQAVKESLASIATFKDVKVSDSRQSSDNKKVIFKIRISI